MDMASGINKAILVGQLGQDPELRHTQQGRAVCTLRVAVNERRKDGDAWKDHVQWFDVVTWDKTAENVSQFLKKGRQIYAEGRIETRQFKDREGVEREKTDIVAHTVLFLGGNDGDRKGGDRY